MKSYKKWVRVTEVVKKMHICRANSFINMVNWK